MKTEFVCISYCVFGFGGFTSSFLWEVLTSPYLIFYLLLIFGLYVVHGIDLSLSFSKNPSLLKSVSGRKSYHHFRLPSFSVDANPVLTGIFTGRPAQGRRNRVVHRDGQRSARRAPDVHRKPSLRGFPAQARRSPGCAPGGPAQSAARPTFDRNLPEFCPQRPYFDLI
jgi:hypothetical protein